MRSQIISRVLHKGEGSNRVDLDFCMYRDISIKSAERELRGKNLAAGQKVKQFKNFLRSGDNEKSHQIRYGTLTKITDAANQQRYRSIIVSSEDTDVRILCFAFSFSIDELIYQCCVFQLNAQYVDIRKIAYVIGQDACKALPGLHHSLVVMPLQGLGK